MGREQKFSRLDLAIEAVQKRREEWNKEHPNNEVEPVCPFCRGSGLKIIIKDMDGNKYSIKDRYNPGMYEYLVPCSCAKGEVNKIERNNKRFANVPGLYVDAKLENFNAQIHQEMRDKEICQAAKNDAIRYISAFKEYEEAGLGLYIYSSAKGSGKSRLASTISNELSERGVRNKFASASSILSEIQNSWNDKSASEHKIIESYISPRLLIIDDIGAKSGQNWMDEKFFQIIDARYQQNKPTIFTSNYEDNRLPFDARITDRISDIERFHLVKMPNHSIRLIDRTGGHNKFYEIYEEKRKEAKANE